MRQQQLSLDPKVLVTYTLSLLVSDCDFNCCVLGSRKSKREALLLSQGSLRRAMLLLSCAESGLHSRSASLYLSVEVRPFSFLFHFRAVVTRQLNVLPSQPVWDRHLIGLSLHINNTAPCCQLVPAPGCQLRTFNATNTVAQITSLVPATRLLEDWDQP